MANNINLSEMIQTSIKWRIEDAVEQTKKEAKEILDKKIDQIAVDVAIEVQQSQLLRELGQEIRLVIHKQV